MFNSQNVCNLSNFLSKNCILFENTLSYLFNRTIYTRILGLIIVLQLFKLIIWRYMVKVTLFFMFCVLCSMHFISNFITPSTEAMRSAWLMMKIQHNTKMCLVYYYVFDHTYKKKLARDLICQEKNCIKLKVYLYIAKAY